MNAALTSTPEVASGIPGSLASGIPGSLASGNLGTKVWSGNETALLVGRRARASYKTATTSAKLHSENACNHNLWCNHVDEVPLQCSGCFYEQVH